MINRDNSLIYIDIGHNVKGDNGAEFEGGLSENVCAMQIGNATKDILEKWGYKVGLAFTKEAKEYVETIEDSDEAQKESLRLRCKEANDNHATLYVSIHLNSNPPGLSAEEKGRGTAIYAMTNRERFLANSILGYITNQHYELGADEFSDGTQMIGKPYKNLGVRDGSGLYVIRNTYCPAILIEACFVDNPYDYGLYLDKKPYINHEKTILEEGIEYVNENVFSYNFFGYCIARGIVDYINNQSTLTDDPEKLNEFEGNEEYNRDLELLDVYSKNYVCVAKNNSNVNAIIHSNKYEDVINDDRILSVCCQVRNNAYLRDDYIVYLGYNNFNSISASYADVSKDALESKVCNLASLGTYQEQEDGEAIEFTLTQKCNIYRADGSPYCTLNAYDRVGIYCKGANDKAWETMYGPVECEETKPNWIKINYCIRNEKYEKLFNEYGRENYAWIETNLGSAINKDDFSFYLE